MLLTPQRGIEARSQARQAGLTNIYYREHTLLIAGQNYVITML